MLACDGKRYAVYVEDRNTDPVIAALATPDGTCELRIPKDRYDAFRVARNRTFCRSIGGVVT